MSVERNVRVPTARLDPRSEPRTNGAPAAKDRFVTDPSGVARHVGKLAVGLVGEGRGSVTPLPERSGLPQPDIPVGPGPAARALGLRRGRAAGAPMRDPGETAIPA